MSDYMAHKTMAVITYPYIDPSGRVPGICVLLFGLVEMWMGSGDPSHGQPGNCQWEMIIVVIVGI